MEIRAAERTGRDAGPGGVTVITGSQAQVPGYTAFTDAELGRWTATLIAAEKDVARSGSASG